MTPFESYLAKVNTWLGEFRPDVGSNPVTEPGVEFEYILLSYTHRRPPRETAQAILEMRAKQGHDHEH